jgi:16S rRNA (cytosine1402-N4)-methyltransferase
VVLAIDRDPEAVAQARVLAADDARLLVEHAEFSALAELVRRHGLEGRVDGVLLDLGVSSPQLDTPGRGFSFLHDGPLDMRMNPASESPTAANWLAQASEREIAAVLWKLGEEPSARRIARAIVQARRVDPIERTAQLAAIICAVKPSRPHAKHPATRCFQALRIHVNRELEEVTAGLQQGFDALTVGGRLVVISFHSLEDRIVKRFLRRAARGDDLPPGVPVTAEMQRPRMRLLGAPLRPSNDEIARNPRARSAVLRAGEKLG